MELRRYALLVWRWLWLIILGTALAAGAAFLVSRRTQPVYSATATLLVNQSQSTVNATDYASIITSERLARTYTELLRTPRMLDQVIDKLNLPVTSGRLAGQIQVQLVRDTQLLRVTVEDTDPTMAADIANTLAQVFEQNIEAQQLGRYATLKDSLNEQIQQIQQDIASTQVEIDALRGPLSPAEESRRSQLQTTLAQYRSSLTLLTNNLTQIRLAEANAASSVSVAQEAQVPAGPIRPRTLTNTALAAVVGALLGVGIAFLIEYLDDTIKTPEDVEQVAQSSTLGVIARIDGSDAAQKLVTALSPRSPISEAYRALRTNIQFSSVDKPLRSVLVTSGNPTEGKSTTAANLAVVLAQAGKKVVVVDSDLRRPMLHKFFGVTNSRGLTTALLDGVVPVETHLQATEVENLKVLPSGPLPPNPAELLGSQRMAQILEELKQQADVVVLDSPPMLAVTDAMLLSQNVDGTLIVVDAGSTRRAFLGRASELLRTANTRFLGVVLNRISLSRSGYYSYAYQYYYSKDGERRKPSGRGPLQKLAGRNNGKAE